MLNGGLNVVSAPLGALLLVVLPIEGILPVDVVTALMAILPLLFIQIPQPERIARRTGAQETKATVWQEFTAGLRYLRGWPGLLIVGLMTIGINFTIIPAFSLLPLMVKEYFGGMAPLGLMFAGPVADRLGIQAWFLVGGSLCILMGLTGLFIPAVMGIEEKGSNVVPRHEKCGLAL